MYEVVYSPTGERLKTEFHLTTSKGYRSYHLGPDGEYAVFFFKIFARWELRKAFRQFFKTAKGLSSKNKNSSIYRRELFEIRRIPSRPMVK